MAAGRATAKAAAKVAPARTTSKASTKPKPARVVAKAVTATLPVRTTTPTAKRGGAAGLRERKLKFPRLRRVQLNAFSLYRRQPTIDLRVPKGVLCLAGANGIGKSTFLATVNYALTGVVPVPERPFKSFEEYHVEAQRFTRGYFSGRIDEEDRDAAAVTVVVSVGTLEFKLTRGIFEPEALRELCITDRSAGRALVVFDEPGLPDSERHGEYRRRMADAVGLSSFEQFTFFQHFVLTFDEGRSLLFWNPTALQSAMFLAFGADPAAAGVADRQRRAMEKAESLGRNLKYQALGISSRLDTLRAALDGGEEDVDYADLRARFDLLHDTRNAAARHLELAERAAGDAEVSLADATAKLLTLRDAYTKAFASHIGQQVYIDVHPAVVHADRESECDICGSRAPEVAAAVRRALESRHCPFCESALRARQGDAPDIEALRALDADISEARRHFETATTSRDRLLTERDGARAALAAADERVAAFEADHTEATVRWRSARGAEDSSVARAVEQLKEELDRLLRERREKYDEAARARQELQALQRRLQQQYVNAEAVFVPRFRELAELFLGIELDILVEGRAGTGFTLVPQLKTTKRREYHQLSESQRFFLDIALRMALAAYAAAPGTASALFIDTPEGALDIAYEARAGSMFAEFALHGHDILMTANINTSEMLHKLAATCGREHMALVRMTAWTDLSDVQLEGEALFHKAYADIERQLRAGDGVA